MFIRANIVIHTNKFPFILVVKFMYKNIKWGLNANVLVRG
jgi:hypothetical protein